MTEPMSDERLAQLRSGNEPLGDHLSGLTADEVGELLAEVDRLRERIGRTVALTDLGGYAGPITFVDDEHGHPQPQWPTP